MKIVLVHPGASWATADVYSGVLGALQRAGADVVQYALDGRIQYQNDWLKWVWRYNERRGVHYEPYTEADILYAACEGIVLKALRHQADWVLVIAGTYVHPEAYIMLKRAGLKLAILMTESPYDDKGEGIGAQFADVVFTNERTSVPFFQQMCKRVYYWQHAIDPAKHHLEPEPQDVETLAEIPAHDVVFVGTGFMERVKMLESVNWDGIDFGLYGSWTLVGSRNPLRKHLRADVIDNRFAAALYRKAKVGLNLHRTSKSWGRNPEHIALAESMNPRCYELAACGLFFVSDYRAEVSEVFGGLVPTFSTPNELEALIRRYLADDQARITIAEQLPACVAGHTFDERIKQLLAVLDGERN